MPHIFCTSRFASLVGKDRIKKMAVMDPAHKLDFWNADLFYVDKKKCILFTNKQTLFSIVRLNILKKDLADLETFFLQALRSQFQAEGIDSYSDAGNWLNNISEVIYHPTDNDKKVIGSMNNFIYNMKAYFYYNGKSIDSVTDNYIAANTNDIPMGLIGNQSALTSLTNFKNNT